jgi:hypothetical protein
MKNRIINGDMRIDQRYNGAANTTLGAAGTYMMDRWVIGGSQTLKLKCQQMDAANSSASNYESGAAPEGFQYSAKITSNSAYTVTGNEYFYFAQQIEANNLTDLDWGISTAKSVTISFWTKSSITGTFGGSVQNHAENWMYSFPYTISQANTWEKKTVTIPGPTSGTWLKGNLSGCWVWFGLGATGIRVGTAGSWGIQSAAGLQPTGTVSLVGTNAATLYITGVQFERGETASSFEYRSIGTELSLCQRYYETLIADSAGVVALHWYYASGNYWHFWYFKTQKRAPATVSLFSGNWTNAVPQIYSGIDTCSFNASAAAYANITSGNKALVANAEL